jgi:hypothetical protein
MRQTRIKLGNDFEISTCESMGWKHHSKSPTIKWSGVGRSNFKKIESLNFDPTKFKPSDNSNYSKFDAINENNEKVEIKKYTKSDLNSWKLYSEPMFKVADWKSLVSVINIFGNDGVKRNIKLKDLYPECSERYNNLIIDGDKDKAITKYNNFISELSKSEICKNIIDKITKSNIGIQIVDCFIPQSDLEYRWNISTSDWAGFHRYRIEFKLK